ncbi:transmembrane and death domain protein 1-like [Hippocampus zosterae]|uniref:transmembrane and death domain protein 1-like n=1 Tax=Hippocampus zosterae TaxID=109293 RepID=UPI00223E79FD|nr:transmembrane and death domain protein 1-like [Hippocampus zosterae]
MQVWKCGLFLFLFAHSLALEEEEEEETVAEDIGVHQLERLVELLAPSECEDLLVALSNSEEITQRIVKRDTSSLEESEAKCRRDLKERLQKSDPEMYYDRLTRALHHIGRADIANELGKNINQDKILNLKRYAEGYHEFFKSMNFEEAEPETGKTKRQKRASDLTWRDLDLIVERPPVPAYSTGPLDVALPLLYGILLGFGGTLLAAISTLYIVLRISRRSQKSCRPRVRSLPSYEVITEN